mmetsp:Transcript_4328/g.5971  ORF Transcript_4328/g.5971 Transcript_4328/m.5971 type:complete len:174 (-) Transcript_4328:510-1031(-)
MVHKLVKGAVLLATGFAKQNLCSAFLTTPKFSPVTKNTFHPATKTPFPPIGNHILSPVRSRMGLTQSFSTKSDFVSLVVHVEIKEDRLEEFLKVIEADAVGSRTKENGGCLRFDVLQDSESKTKFTFYEVYKDNSAVEFHKSTDHYKLWTDFKSTGAVLSQTVMKGETLFFTG